MYDCAIASVVFEPLNFPCIVFDNWGGDMINKKWLARVAAVLVVCVASLVVATPAMAIMSWCDADPVINIDGHIVSMNAAILGDPQDIRGHVTFNVTVPRGTQVSIISIDEGAKVKIKYDKKSVDTVAISVNIKTKTTYEAKLIVVMDDQQLAEVLGTTNSPLEYAFSLP
jgi:hypothetical protein